MSQGTLLSDLTGSSLILPEWGWMHDGELFEPSTPGRPTSEHDSSLLLPTPSADESTPADEYIKEMKEADIRPDERLYLPGRKWHSQRTLSRIAPSLLPTPTARDSTNAANRTAKRQPGSNHKDGVTLIDAMRLVHTGLPFTDGNESPVSAHPDQLTIEDASPPRSLSG